MKNEFYLGSDLPNETVALKNAWKKFGNDQIEPHKVIEVLTDEVGRLIDAVQKIAGVCLGDKDANKYIGFAIDILNGYDARED